MIPLIIIRECFNISRQKPGVHCWERRMKNDIEYLCTDRNYWHRGKKSEGVQGVAQDRPANSEYLRTMFGSMGFWTLKTHCAAHRWFESISGPGPYEYIHQNALSQTAKNSQFLSKPFWLNFYPNLRLGLYKKPVSYRDLQFSFFFWRYLFKRVESLKFTQWGFESHSSSHSSSSTSESGWMFAVDLYFESLEKIEVVSDSKVSKKAWIGVWQYGQPIE